MVVHCRYRDGAGGSRGDRNTEGGDDSDVCSGERDNGGEVSGDASHGTGACQPRRQRRIQREERVSEGHSARQRRRRLQERSAQGDGGVQGTGNTSSFLTCFSAAGDIVINLKH